MLDDGKPKDFHRGKYRNQPFIRTVMLCKLSDFRPHSSSDPLTRATFPPGEGFWVENPTFLNL